MNEHQTEPSLRDVARNAGASARYLADIQSVVEQINENLKTLRRETRIYCRNTHVKDDKWYHPRLRAIPVDRPLAAAIRHATALANSLEFASRRRRAHDDAVRALPDRRRERQLARDKKFKEAAALRSTPETPPVPTEEPSNEYTGPQSVWDIKRGEKSA
ncbi:hypothetical protein OIE69_43880 (plasmid) [Actinacidiphila glaucinigra]|uniref:hypothetical protein n=1 Tax=Actinacidiphila glaucinigra TaxID=235986 RepID=UPI002DD7CD72|nr:hypothetical protein [Actinacidiphila glaucinigra]WSD65845.1 hypothetical protein OIE69_43880 [Actinacidiphila glaucinigra]